jgi:hypothetical protein
MKRHITLVLLLAAVLCLSGCAGRPQNPAPHAVQPDVAERYALATFAGCPENGLRVAGTHDDHSVRQKYPASDKERAQLLWVAHMNGRKAQVEEVVVREVVYAE